MALTREERETIIIFDEQHSTAEVSTYNAKLSRRLRELQGDRPTDVKLIRENAEGGITFQCPKSWIRINPPKAAAPLTEEQKAQRRAVLSRARQART